MPKSGRAFSTLRARMKHTIVLVLSNSMNPESCVPTRECEYPVFPCKKHWRVQVG